MEMKSFCDIRVSCSTVQSILCVQRQHGYGDERQTQFGPVVDSVVPVVWSGEAPTRHMSLVWFSEVGRPLRDPLGEYQATSLQVRLLSLRHRYGLVAQHGPGCPF